MKNIVGTLPPNTYVLDCSPYGPPKILQVDPSILTPEERKMICIGISTFSLHKEFALKATPDGNFNVIKIKPNENDREPQ